LSQIKNTVNKTREIALRSLGLKPLLRDREKLDTTNIRQAVTVELAAELRHYPLKSSLIAYPLWLFLGFSGGHRFYLGKPISAVLMLITLGGLGIWWLIDGLRLLRLVRKRNSEQERREREGDPPLGLEFVPEIDTDISNSTPHWVKERGTFSRNTAYVFDCVAVAVLCLALGSIALSMEMYEPLFSAFLITVLFLGGDYLVRFFHVPFVHELLCVDYKLKLYYFYNRPPNLLVLLFRPFFMVLGAAFSKKTRIEMKLYLELGGIFAIPFILLEVAQWVAEGMSTDILDGIVGRILALYAIVYLFTCPLGAIFVKQELKGYSARKMWFIGIEVIVLLTGSLIVGLV